MGGIKFSVHPLFFIFGFYHAITGRIAVFLICTVSALCHELGHSWCAQNRGYRLNKITLMPFGAVVKGDIEGLKKKDEVKIALAGPLINIAIAVFFVASWWIYPEAYAFTDVVVAVNVSMAIVNFIPAYPLDGGRILYAFSSEKLGQKRAQKLCSIFGVVLSIGMLALFIISVFYEVNLSLLFFSLFCLFGAISSPKDCKYVKIFTPISQKALERGVECKRQAVSVNSTVKQVMLVLDPNAVNELLVFDGEDKVKTLSQREIAKIVEKAEIYQPIGKYID